MFRNARAEQKAETAYRRKAEIVMEQLYSQLQQELELQEDKNGRLTLDSLSLQRCDVLRGKCLELMLNTSTQHKDPGVTHRQCELKSGSSRLLLHMRKPGNNLQMVKITYRSTTILGAVV